MSKMTISGLKSAMATYVAAAKQAGAWSNSTNNFVGLLDKIGKQVSLDGSFQDKLPELSGENLPLGKTIEEYFIDLTLPTAWTSASTDGANTLVPAIPSVEAVSYCYTLGREFVKTSLPYDNFERACLNANEAGNIGAKIMERLQNSYSMTAYAEKKQLLGNMIDKGVTAGCYSKVAKPVDTTTGEGFIEFIKKCAEDASFAHEGDCLAQVAPVGQAGHVDVLIGATPSLVLYIKKGIIPNIEVQTLAGAFNKEDLAMPVRIKVIDDFGTMTNSKDVYALLVDERGVKLHNGYNVIRSQENGEGDFINYVRHFEHTGFISKYVYVKAIGEQN